MTAINPVTDLSTVGDVGVITIDSPPVNALSSPVRQGIFDAVAAAEKDPDIKAIVLLCAGRTFIAGADIAEFAGGAAPAPSLREVVEALEACSKLTIAAIHGTALGGGLEVALACHYRMAVPSARCGMPEVNIGILPGSGGTQRLPRLIGVTAALDLITTGRHVPAVECMELGLIDDLAPEGELRQTAVAFAYQLAAAERKPRRISREDALVKAARGQPEIFEAVRKAGARKWRNLLAPENCIRAVEAAVNLPFAEGIKEERRLFAELMAAGQARAQQYYFFAERRAAKIPDVPDDTEILPVNSVGVLGAGTMGGGIAMTFANAGMPVTLVEVEQQALDRGLSVIRANYERTAARGGMTPQQVEARMGLITGTLDFDALSTSDLVIEAVFEQMELKKDVFRRLDAACRKGAILASNTSYLDIDEMAAVTGRPESVIGLHFFSPANVMKLLEVVRGERTDKRVIATAMKLAKRIGKVLVLVRVGHGFVGNRMLAQRTRESQNLLFEGALPWDIDRVLYDFGFPMGPFAMGDLAGLDIGWAKEKSTGSTIREVLCEMGRRGQKAGAGYYDYDAERNAVPSPITEQIVKDFAARSGREPRDVSDEEILERTIYPMINEGARILEEGKAIRASDIDVIWVNGYGFPVYRGGPMHYADAIGLDKVLAGLRRFQAAYGEAWTPAPLLERLAAEGKGFRDLN